ncbi:YgaP family membrane protein [Clostridium sp. ZS2-4]|uniref:YgaP family membrane protein n=1 Tax=Clostridium sp. ZS2-4 TaxID=2987703 RepID=UPI00227B158D|nr:DUF2892 domain-containing protein [Clostridium sp. ZS2-4]MCY6355061.1 DUF2892 domain-containing protein [Clostridium sp. ZS2-4]
MYVYLEDEYLGNKNNTKNKKNIYRKREIRKILPKTMERVEKHTNSEINKRIYKETLLGIGRYLDKSNEEISARIEELEKEWDVERVVETKAASLILAGIVLGSTVNKKWYALSGVVGGFLLQHAVQGWCPSLPLIRRMGYRTPTEIHEEMAALRFIRGDFNHLKRD